MFLTTTLALFPSVPPVQWSNEQVLLLDSAARQFLTDIESRILESRLPVTVAVHEDGEEVAMPYRKL